MAFTVATNFGTTGARLTTGGDDTTGWSGGGQEPDFRYQGSYCYSLLVKTSEDGFTYTRASALNWQTARLVALVKVIATNKDVLDGDGVQVWIGNDSTHARSFFIYTALSYPIPGGFQIIAIDPQVTGAEGKYASQNETNAPTLSDARYFAFRADFSATAKSQNFGADAIEVIENGKGLVGYGATGSFEDFITFDEGTISNRYGVVQSRGGIMFINGVLKIGRSSEQTTFVSQNRVIVFPDHHVTTGFCGLDLDIQHASTTIDIRNAYLSGRGVLASSADRRPDYEVIGTSGAVTLDGSTFNVYRLITLNSKVSARGCTFLQGGQRMVSGGADLRDSAFSGYAGAADTSVLGWDVASDPDGKLDGCTFVKGTNAHHAIRLGASAPTTLTLRGLTFSGFNTSDGQNDSVLYLADQGSDKTWTITAVGCSGTVSYKKARSGDTVIIKVDPVTLSVHVQDVDTQADIVGARVWVPVTSSVGGKPYQASVTITSSGTTATVAHTAHGLSTGDFVHIEGANEDHYDGTHQITVTGVDSYTYIMSDTSSSPATGTITATFVVISGTTDGDGDIVSTEYSWVADQPISGRVRKGSAATYYKTGAISGIIDAESGLAVTVNMVPD